MATEDRRVLVTGASRGFGAACVDEFSEAGWDVHWRRLWGEEPLCLLVNLGSIQDQAAGRYRDYNTSYAYRISTSAQNMATV